MNPYETLGVTETSSSDDIKKAYRLLSKKHHPDMGSEPDVQRMSDITTAYGIITDPDKLEAWKRGENPGQDRQSLRLAKAMEYFTNVMTALAEDKYLDNRNLSNALLQHCMSKKAELSQVLTRKKTSIVQAIDRDLRSLAQEAQGRNAGIEKMQAIYGRVTKAPEDDRLRMLTESAIRHNEMRLQQIDAEVVRLQALRSNPPEDAELYELTVVMEAVELVHGWVQQYEFSGPSLEEENEFFEKQRQQGHVQYINVGSGGAHFNIFTSSNGTNGF